MIKQKKFKELGGFLIALKGIVTDFPACCDCKCECGAVMHRDLITGEEGEGPVVGGCPRQW